FPPDGGVIIPENGVFCRVRVEPPSPPLPTIRIGNSVVRLPINGVNRKSSKRRRFCSGYCATTKYALFVFGSIQYPGSPLMLELSPVTTSAKICCSVKPRYAA